MSSRAGRGRITHYSGVLLQPPLRVVGVVIAALVIVCAILLHGVATSLAVLLCGLVSDSLSGFVVVVERRDG